VVIGRRYGFVGDELDLYAEYHSRDIGRTIAGLQLARR
jgi:hypothetical protein